MDQKGFTISFSTINNHRLDEFKTRLGGIIQKEIKKKRISTSDIQRQIKAFGYDYPIYRVLANDDLRLSVPFELYGILAVLVGIDIYLIPNEEINNSRRNIKNRDRVKQIAKC